MALLKDTNTLKQLLVKHELSNVYEKLVAKGYSKNLLEQCSEKDVEELSRDLALDLIHRLRFKRCLKEIGIPQSVYTIITQKEQLIMNDINSKLLAYPWTNDCIENDNKTFKQNEELINCTLDSIINLINKKRKAILISLSDNYKNKKEQNKQILNCQNALKEAKIKCESLFIPNKNNINFDERYQTITNIWTEWQNKYKNIELVHKININFKDMSNIRQTINNSIQISAQKLHLMQYMENNKEKKEKKISINGLKYDEKEIDAIQIPSMQNKLINDAIDAVNDKLIFEHRPVRAWRLDHEQNKWRGRGKGQLSVYYNSTNGAKIIFLDQKHNKTRLLQYIDGQKKAQYIGTVESGHGVNTDNEQIEEGDTVKWHGRDYSMDASNPMVGEWALRFENNYEDNERIAAAQFVHLFNGYIDTQIVFAIGAAPQLQVANNNNKNTGNIWGAFAFNDDIKNKQDSPFANINWMQSEAQKVESVEKIIANVNEEENCKDLPFKAIVNLSEQSVPSGHEKEILIKEIAFGVLYVFGFDVVSVRCWKERARQSKVCFYKSTENNKIRMVVRENETNKLRMNHYVPSGNEIAKIHLKSEKVYSWNGSDGTLDAPLSSFCIKFEDKTAAKAFFEQFQSAMVNNKESGNMENAKDKSVEIIQVKAANEENGSVQVPEAPFSFSFGENGDGFANISWGNNQNENEFNFGANQFNFNQESEVNASETKTAKDCPICYENPMRNALQTECGHSFCGDCIKQALDTNSDCPMCRKKCSIDELINADFVESFADNKDINFGEYMNNIKHFVTTDIANDDSKQTEVNNEENACSITFKPIANYLKEKEVLSGHEGDTFLAEYEVRKLYRWGKDVSNMPCWKTRASETKLMFYQNIKNSKIRLVCRENLTNKLRLNQWIPALENADINKKTDKQIAWTAFDVTVENEDNSEGGNNANGYFMFAAKFKDIEIANGFVKQLKAASVNNERLHEAKNDMDDEEVNDDDDEEENKENDRTKLDEYEIEELFIWDNDDWKQHAVNTKLELYQNGSNGVMTLICKGNDDNERLKLNHWIPAPNIANIKQKDNNAVHWEASDKNNNNNENVSTFNAKFKDLETANKFISYFKAGSMNNSQIKLK